MILNIKVFNGFTGLMGKIGSMLIKLSPIYIIIFIACGDRFLPSPLSDLSANTRNTINGILVGSFNKDIIKNDKYNNKKTDKIIKEVENSNK
ncbi:hypothetical protein [Geminocystis sp. GBBB08]|uniref:hypothetical protein n=1 Tax=Geminocystis sp. GBBB08 TaxID=2604140 RepID=UPI0027E2CF35|nr:hypothetical protein [Geminocystis sp. GBBB08]MBL1208461.1 hypothetical protein [Geminocystis sp. GBBB08]